MPQIYTSISNYVTLTVSEVLQARPPILVTASDLEKSFSLRFCQHESI